ncbi:MAG: YggS family pyridoxal phosphate-dependent enzyme [Gammaproteobacteria bacterium]|nr:YggS family pyridoxal phosphate-dependent enzyme [Gammaproteobacteria bacterium]
MIRVTENLSSISHLLAETAIEAGRDPGSVKLLAVSKKQPISKISAAAAAGQRDFGENFVQEGLEKIQSLAELPLTWHFIGHLQSNKTRDVAEYFDWVHTIDRLKTAKRLSQQRPDGLAPLNICLQVNVDDENSKSGVSANELPGLATACAGLRNIRLRGLMCLPAIREDFEAQRAPFARLRALYEALRHDGLDLDTLSMGMSNDFRAAVFEGATIVRIGTAVFGERK